MITLMVISETSARIRFSVTSFANSVRSNKHHWAHFFVDRFDDGCLINFTYR